MKKLNYRKIFTVLLWSISIAALSICLGFVSKKTENIVASNLNISISNNDENLFLSENDVKKFFSDRKDNILNERYQHINIHTLENALKSHPAIENAEVSANLNGEIKIDIKQRTPVLRIINRDGESYYIDSRTELMPLNENYTARVIVASGELFEPYARRFQYSIEKIKRSQLYSEVSLLDDVYDVANYISNDSVLAPLIHQIYVNKEKELELFPAVGNHKIIFGNASSIDLKFNKLKLFYTQGLNKADAWTKYSLINLKYNNLVVCTKK